MEKKYITDTDFLPQELTHYHGEFSDEMNDGLYQIVYGILAPSQTLSNVYDVVIRVVSKENSPAIRKFKLQTWKKSIDAILKALNKVDTKGFEVIVYVPLRDCEISLSAAQSYFQLAIFTISELLETNSIPEPVCPKDFVPNIKKLFEENYSELFLALDEGEPDDKEHYERAKYFKDIVLDEMYRRGIDTIKLKQEVNPINPVQWLDNVVAGKEVECAEKRILPSQYYDQPALYKEIFIERGLQLELNAESLTINASELPTAFDNDTIETRAAVMFFMLDSFCDVTKDNFNRAVAMIDFAVGKQTPKFNVNKANDKETNKVNNNNSIKKYVRNFMVDKEGYLELPTSDKVRARLSEQGFEVPSINKAKNP